MTWSTHSRQKTCMQRVRHVVFSRSLQTLQAIFSRRSRIVLREISSVPAPLRCFSFRRSSTERLSWPSSFVCLRSMALSWSWTRALAVVSSASLALRSSWKRLSWPRATSRSRAAASCSRRAAASWPLRWPTSDVAAAALATAKPCSRSRSSATVDRALRSCFISLTTYSVWSTLARSASRAATSRFAADRAAATSESVAR
mmetsp:Transcript_25079/g.85950  ORF Transcript_25079/g.85950 Transcript_25079/m.85950 type:complete len:201 (+) Transcript_25079:113-715(+)